MPWNLQRFLEAQEPIFEIALSELRSGRKCSHWMWYVFPQLAGLGSSEKSVKYGVHGLDEAKAYLAHEELHRRLEEATRAVFHSGTPVEQIFGHIDYLKFVSCMTLFMLASEPQSMFEAALRQVSTSDKKTIETLGVNHEQL